MYVCMYAREHVCVVYAYINTYIQADIQKYIHTVIHTYTHIPTYIHTYIHAYIYIHNVDTLQLRTDLPCVPFMIYGSSLNADPLPISHDIRHSDAACRSPETLSTKLKS